MRVVKLVSLAEDGSLACHVWRLSCCVKKLRKRGIGLTAIFKTRFGVVGMAQLKIWRMRAIVVSALQARRCKWRGISRV